VFFGQWYNAVMNKRFQFRLRLMFSEMALLCVAAGLIAIMLRTDFGQVVRFAAAAVLLGSALGAAIGLPFRKAFAGAAFCAMLSAIGVVAYYAIIFSALTG
jgi:hypothetical protein